MKQRWHCYLYLVTTTKLKKEYDSVMMPMKMVMSLVQIKCSFEIKQKNDVEVFGENHVLHSTDILSR